MKRKIGPEALGVMYVICRDCGAQFTISENEQRWLRDKGLEPFSRCKDCRQRRREKKAREAMLAPPGAKRRPW